MIINTQYKIIYLSNCKCASTTIRKHFLPVQNKELVKKVQNCGMGNQHMTYHEVLKALEYHQKNINTEAFFIFSTIRNPWERMVSLYNYAQPDKNGVPFWGPRFGNKREEGTSCSFEKFIFNGLDAYSNKTSDPSFRYACKNVQDMFGENYNKIKIYKSEELDVNKIIDDINYSKLEAKVGRVKFKIIDSNSWKEKEKIESKNYREYYNDELRNIIADNYDLDIKIGEYEF